VAFRHIGGQWRLSFPSISHLSSLLPPFISNFRAPIGANGSQGGGVVNATNYNIHTTCHINKTPFGK
jgi:hypothetical protein